jgi:hypothetical protein
MTIIPTYSDLVPDPIMAMNGSYNERPSSSGFVDCCGPRAKIHEENEENNQSRLGALGDVNGLFIACFI